MLLLKAGVKLNFADIPTVVTIDRIVAALCSELEALLLMQRRSTMEQSMLAARSFVSVGTAERTAINRVQVEHDRPVETMERFSNPYVAKDNGPNYCEREMVRYYCCRAVLVATLALFRGSRPEQLLALPALTQ